MTQWKAPRSCEEIYNARADIAINGIPGKIARLSQIIRGNEAKLLRDIEEACKLNRVDAEKAQRAALSGVRSKYYRLFWKATTLPEAKAIEQCNRYAEALLELGVIPRGFKQSLRYRESRLPERAKEIGIEVFRQKGMER